MTLKLSDSCLQCLYVGVVLMILQGGNGQVLRSVVVPDAVQVMHDLALLEAAPECALHDNAVFGNTPFLPDDSQPNVSVSLFGAATPPCRIRGAASSWRFVGPDGDTSLAKVVLDCGRRDPGLSGNLRKVQSGGVEGHGFINRDSRPDLFPAAASGDASPPHALGDCALGHAEFSRNFVLRLAGPIQPNNIADMGLSSLSHTWSIA